MSSAIDSPAAQRAARYALAILTLINLFNYLDRWVVASVLESIKKSELHPSDTQLGLRGLRLQERAFDAQFQSEMCDGHLHQ